MSTSTSDFDVAERPGVRRGPSLDSERLVAGALGGAAVRARAEVGAELGRAGLRGIAVDRARTVVRAAVGALVAAGAQLRRVLLRRVASRLARALVRPTCVEMNQWAGPACNKLRALDRAQ